MNSKTSEKSRPKKGRRATTAKSKRRRIQLNNRSILTRLAEIIRQTERTRPDPIKNSLKTLLPKISLTNKEWAKRYKTKAGITQITKIQIYSK
jgi:hypothetical protein